MFLTKKVSVCILSWVALVAAPTVVLAEIKLPSVLAEHMVVQRDMPVHLWGTAAPGETVHAEFRGNKAEATADAKGAWSMTLPKGSAGGPFTLTLQGTNKITFKDVLVGDVWVASGQSNMAYMMDKDTSSKTGVPDTSVAKANYPTLRIFHVKNDASSEVKDDVTAPEGWTAVTPQSVQKFSAIAYFFGREIVTNEKIPVGIIGSYTGATSAEVWTSQETLADRTLLSAGFHGHGTAKGGEAPAPKKARGGKIVDGVNIGHDASSVADMDPDEATAAGYTASQVYNAMIAPLTRFPIKGVIWYQGNANAKNTKMTKTYQRLFPALIKDWRMHWGEDDFPFIFVQLAGRDDPKIDLAGLRQAQLMTLSTPNTGMAITIDVGDPKIYHPANKPDIGHRLALVARAQVYGEKLEAYGPLFAKATPSGNKLIVSFTHTTGGLVVKGDKLTSFEVAGADGKFVPAEASVAGDTVVVSSSSVAAPMYVRYAYAGYPPTPLYNGEKLPAAPFTSKPN